MEPVYPKPNPEYRQQVLNEFYKKVKNTSWESCSENEYQGKPRGRKMKGMNHPESKPRTPGERQVWEQQQLNKKQQHYNWFDKWTTT